MMANEEAITAATHEHQFNRRYEYDVFVSFRGADTRQSFTGNLYNALRRKRFKSFIDNDGIKKGDRLSPSYLFKILEVSRISVVVFSKDYASSTYCLDELVHILQCQKRKNLQILPIFYGTNPSEVRKQTGSYGHAFDAHKHRFGKDSERVQKWKSALSEAANLCGFDFRFYRYEYELIEDIVRHVAGLLPRYQVFLSSSQDTRYSFKDHLYNALDREGLITFVKDKEWKEEWDQSSQSLVKVIEKSRLSIIVLSEKYAYSSSCLDELVTVLDSMKINNQTVWPVFYKVEPSDVRHQRKSYGKAMTEHEIIFGKDSDKVQTWRSALFEVANIKGWHLKYGYEYDLIEKIVETASKI